MCTCCIPQPLSSSVFKSLAETKRKSNKLEMKDGYDRIICVLFPCVWSNPRSNKRKKLFYFIFIYFFYNSNYSGSILCNYMLNVRRRTQLYI